MEKFNKCQTPLEELRLDTYPQEVQEQFWDFLDTVPFIKWMVSPDRPLISECPRDDEGKVTIDVTRPPILENTKFFRQAAIAFANNGKRYSTLRPNANPNSDFGRWLREERRRGWEGLIDPSTGMWVTGDMYWLLNYCPIHQVVKDSKGMALRVVNFPKFWDGQFLMTHYMHQARLHGHHAAELASRGKGKAHPYSQVVYTPDGMRRWGDIQVGDLLFGDDGKPTRVTMVPFDEEEDIYTVTLSDGRSLSCTSGHLFRVRDCLEHSSECVIDLWEMMHSGYTYESHGGTTAYRYSLPNNGAVEFSPQSVPIDPYSLGLLLGGGLFSMSSTNTVEFTSEEGDIDIYQKSIPYRIGSGKTPCSHTMEIPGIKGFLKKHGMYSEFPQRRFIPREYMFNSSDVRMEVLRGLMDTCGIVDNEGAPTFTTASLRLADDIRWLCHSLGYSSLLPTGHLEYEGGPLRAGYTVAILTNDAIFRLPRKLKELAGFPSVHGQDGKDWTSIVDIRYSHREKAKCVIVNNDSHCYLIGDFVVTHNTSLGGGMLSRRCILGESHDNRSDVQCWVTATDRTKLMGENQILSIFTDNLDFCAKNTQFAGHRLTSSRQEMLWKMGYKKPGSDVEHGSKNSVQGIITGVNQDKLNGSRGVLYLIEEAGIFRDLLSMYTLIRPSVEQGDDVFGEIILYGTAGDEQSDFQDFQEIIYKPKGYNVESLPNVFDKEGQGSQECAIFYPAYLNRDDGCMDADGNSDVTKALLGLLADRYRVKYNSSDITAIAKRISQYPITPQEAILRSHHSIFPITELIERLNQIDNNPSEYDDVYIGELLEGTSGKMEFIPTNDIPIRDFPTKDNKVKGALEIFEMPQKDGQGDVFSERYLASCDPYDDDSSNTMSLGSIFVLDSWTDRLVAEYTGRPEYADDFFEIARKLCFFYNCQMMYENNKKGLFAYFSKKNCVYKLADTPTYLRDKQLIKEIGYGNKLKGIAMYGSDKPGTLRNYGYTLIKEWLIQKVSKVEKDDQGNDIETSIPNLYFIRNRALLRELILWNPNINVDRIMSLMQLMLYRQEKVILYQGDLSKPSTRDSSQDLDNDEFFKRNYPKGF